MTLNIKINDYIKIKKDNTIFNGKVIDINCSYVTLKLDTGYIIGIKLDSVSILEINKENESIKDNNTNNETNNKKNINHNINKNLKNITLLATGGTISCYSKNNYETVAPKLSADEIIGEVKEINNYANIKTKQVMNKLSENIQPSDWITLAKEISKEIESNVDGIIVTCGTDTMVYIASAIAFMIQTPIPIVFTGSQRSPDRPGSDNYMNLICATKVAISDISEVTIVMHETLSDDYCLVHRAVKAKKMHTSRRNTFKSINTKPIARVNFLNGDIEILSKYKKRNETEYKKNINLDLNCSLIKYYPNLSPKIIDYYISQNCKGIILEGVGMGHVSNDWMSYIEKAIKKNIIVIMTSQCPYGRVGCNIYESGSKLLSVGVIEGEDLLPEVALVKMMWLFGNTSNIEYIRSTINKNLIGEIEAQEYE